MSTQPDPSAPTSAAATGGEPAADAMLERNVETLLAAGPTTPAPAPTMDAQAKARVRDALVARHAVAGAGRAGGRARTPLLAIGGGLAAAAAVALAVGAVLGGDGTTGGGGPVPTTPRMQLADGTEILTRAGAKVDVLGPRRVRVTGSVLLDVASRVGPGPGADKVPFVVETPHGTLTVLGTRFVVDAGADLTAAAVIRGAVKVATDQGEVVVRAGERAESRRGQVPTRGPAPRLSHLASWARALRRADEDHAEQPLRNGTLFARDPNRQDQEFRLPMANLTVDAVVHNQVARVALDQTFTNPRERELEGVYRFAIPADAALQRLAMYVDGTLTESAVVERMQARRIYEDLVYRRIDPGLLEWAGAGRLDLRVYPLRAKQDKRLMLAYTQSLPRLYDDWTLAVPLPEVDGPVGTLAMKVRIDDCGACEVHSPSHPVTVSRDGAAAIVTYQEAGAKIGDSLVLTVRDPETSARVARHAEGGQTYLGVRARPQLAAPAAAEHRARTWVILDDVSASRGRSERRAQADLIDRLLTELDEDDRVAVLAFDTTVRSFGALTRVDDVDRRAVREFVVDKEPGGVGATDLGGALGRALEVLAGVAPTDAHIVYLGDGVITGGQRDLGALRAQLGGRAVFVGVGVGDGVDQPTLRALADATGGAAVTLDLADDLGWRAFDLVAMLHGARVTGLSAVLVDAAGVPVADQATYLGAGQLAEGEELDLAARVPDGARPAALILAGQLAGAPWQQRIELASAQDRGAAGYLPRLWAQRHVAARLLAKFDHVPAPPCVASTRTRCPTDDEVAAARREEIRREVVALGKQHFLLSRHTSLLVLENDAMYAKYDVTKGSGATWAPYPLPATVPVAATPVVTAPVASGDEPGLDRVARPLLGPPEEELGTLWGTERAEARGAFGLGVGGGGTGWGTIGTGRFGTIGRGSGTGSGFGLGASGFGPGGGGATAVPAATSSSVSPDDATAPLADRGPMELDLGQAAKAEPAREENKRAWSLADGDDQAIGQGFLGARTRRASRMQAQHAGVLGLLDGRLGHRGLVGGLVGGWMYPQGLSYLGDARLADVTEFMPALVSPELRAGLGALRAAAGDQRGDVDAAARALIERARAATPAGTYVLADGPAEVREYQVSADGELRWRARTGLGLEELGQLDRAGTLRQAYPEFGLVFRRALGDAAPALLWARLPLLMPSADHLARWFQVRADGTRAITLTAPTAPGKVVLRLELDDQAHLVALRDGAGRDLATVTWAGPAPVALTTGGVAQAIRFSPGAGAGPALPTGAVELELPLRPVAVASAALATATAGTDAWRQAGRALIASAVAANDDATAARTYQALARAGAVTVADLALAGRALFTQLGDRDFAAALAPLGAHTLPQCGVLGPPCMLGSQPYYGPSGIAPRGLATLPPLARHLAELRAARRAGKVPAQALTAASAGGGLVATLVGHRDVLAALLTRRFEAAVRGIEAMAGRADELPVVSALLLAQAWDAPPELVVRAMRAVATGRLANQVRFQLARTLLNRGDRRAEASVAALAAMAEVDLGAAPALVDGTMMQAVQAGPGGAAAWTAAWAAYQRLVLDRGDVAHLAALARSAAVAQPGHTDPDAALAALTSKVGADPAGRLEVAQLALALGATDRAAKLVEGLMQTLPQAERPHRLAYQIAVTQNRLPEAATHLEAVLAAGGETTLGELRADHAELLGLYGRQAELASDDATRNDALTAALAVGARWRALDPDHNELDRRMARLLLTAGRAEEAWRYLSTAIERHPYDGAGYLVVGDAQAEAGFADQALATFRQALVLDQTNPAPRLRVIQLLYTLGRPAEGDEVLRQALAVRWHERFWNERYQLDQLARQRKLARAR
ncbi:MAG: FecR domain-containing protein [Kofleriaceae bacterium]|nr:FecR domain-containing protein [Kofleriaceae bacterium]